MILTALGVVIILLRYDLPATDIATYAAYLAIAIALPGIFFWRLLLTGLHRDEQHGPTWFEDLSLGTIFGFGIQLPVYLVGVWIGVPLIIVLLPLAAAVLSFTGLGRRTWTLPTRTFDHRASWILGGTIIYGLMWLGRNAFARRPLDLPHNRPPSIDETFHQALVAEASHHFPPQIPFLLHTKLDYHWFVHAQIATADHATGLDPIVMLREVMPAIVLVLTVLGLGSVALRLTGRPVAAVVAPLILVAGAYQLIGPHYDTFTYSEPFMSRRFVTSPSQSYGVMMSMPALMLLLEVLRPDRKPSRLTWVTLALALLALSGSKATFMPIFLCGTVAVWFLTLVFARRFDRTQAGLVVLVFLVTLFAQTILFGGQTGGMAFDPFATVRAALNAEGITVTTTSRVVMTGMFVVSWLLYGIGAFGLLKQRMWRDPRAVWMIFTIPAGVLVPFVLYRTGLSQLWFQRTVAELVALISAWGLAVLLPRPLTRRHALVFGGAAVAAGFGAWAIAAYAESGRKDILQATLHTLEYTVLLPIVIVVVFLLARLALRSSTFGRWLTPALLVSVILGLGLMNVWTVAYDTVSQRKIATPHFPPLFANGGSSAAHFLKHHSDVDDVVATNVHCARPHARVCDNRSFWVSGFTERRIVIEGWGYTADTNKNYVQGEANAHIPPPDPERLRINDAVFNRPSEQTVQALVDAYNPRWLFVDKEYPADIAGLKALDGTVLKQVFENANYLVFKINTQPSS